MKTPPDPGRHFSTLKRERCGIRPALVSFQRCGRQFNGLSYLCDGR
jgi:hypothetical protein